MRPLAFDVCEIIAFHRQQLLTIEHLEGPFIEEHCFQSQFYRFRSSHRHLEETIQVNSLNVIVFIEEFYEISDCLVWELIFFDLGIIEIDRPGEVAENEVHFSFEALDLTGLFTKFNHYFRDECFVEEDALRIF